MLDHREPDPRADLLPADAGRIAEAPGVPGAEPERVDLRHGVDDPPEPARHVVSEQDRGEAGEAIEEIDEPALDVAALDLCPRSRDGIVQQVAEADLVPVPRKFEGEPAGLTRGKVQVQPV